MAKKLDISSGAHAVLIGFLRQNGGRAEINAKELSQSIGLFRTAISNSIRGLERLGLVKKEQQGLNRAKRSIVVLNEEAVKQYEAGVLAVSGGHKISSSPKTRRSQTFSVIPNEVAKLLQNLEGHMFANPEHVEPLFETAKNLHSKCMGLASVLELKQTEIAKLEDALKGFGMDENEIRESINITAVEIAVAVEYEESAAVPVVDFTKLIAEPANIFKPLAMLQAKTRVLRNLLVEIKRELSKMNLLKQKMSVLLKEKQEEEVIDTSDLVGAYADWRQRSDRYVSQVHAGGVAVVSSRE